MSNSKEGMFKSVSQQDLEDSRKTAGCCSKRRAKDNIRVYEINDDNNKTYYGVNAVTTTKYNVVTFLPKALMYQYMRFANIYFVIVAILSSIPSLSAISASASWMPIFFVLSISLLREGVEDYGRYVQDKKANNQEVLIYDHGT